MHPVYSISKINFFFLLGSFLNSAKQIRMNNTTHHLPQGGFHSFLNTYEYCLPLLTLEYVECNYSNQHFYSSSLPHFQRLKVYLSAAQEVTHSIVVSTRTPCSADGRDNFQTKLSLITALFEHVSLRDIASSETSLCIQSV